MPGEDIRTLIQFVEQPGGSLRVEEISRTPPWVMPPPESPWMAELVLRLKEMLLVREGEIISNEVAEERARNIACWLQSEVFDR